MQPLASIAAVTAPFFALVLCGYLAARQRVLPESAIPGLNAFVLYFALPCLLYRFGAGTPVAQMFNPVMGGVYVLCALVMVGLTIAVTIGEHIHLKDAAFGALVAAFPNAGFMGVPLLVALLGDAAAGPVIGAIVVDLVVTSTLCLALAEAHARWQGSGGAERGLLRGALGSLRGALTNPLPWSIAAGAAFGATPYALAAPVAQIVRMLGDSATPVALFTIGAVLFRAGRHVHTRTALGHYLPVALIKLLLHPALVFGAGLAARALGAPVSQSA